MPASSSTGIERALCAEPTSKPPTHPSNSILHNTQAILLQLPTQLRLAIRRIRATHQTLVIHTPLSLTGFNRVHRRPNIMILKQPSLSNGIERKHRDGAKRILNTVS